MYYSLLFSTIQTGIVIFCFRTNMLNILLASIIKLHGNCRRKWTNSHHISICFCCVCALSRSISLSFSIFLFVSSLCAQRQQTVLQILIIFTFYCIYVRLRSRTFWKKKTLNPNFYFCQIINFRSCTWEKSRLYGISKKRGAFSCTFYTPKLEKISRIKNCNFVLNISV